MDETKEMTMEEYAEGWRSAGTPVRADGTPDGDGIEGGGLAGEGLSQDAEGQSGAAADETPDEAQPQADAHEKALRDTKAWATKLAMENAELKKTIDAHAKGRATSSEVQDARNAADTALAGFDDARNRLYEDFPEFREVLEPLVQHNAALLKDVEALKKQSVKAEHDEALAFFNTSVRPEVVRAHPDFDEILFKKVNGQNVINEEYFEWADAQPPAVRFAAMESAHPQDIIMAVGMYKKFKNSGAAASLKQAEEQKNKEKLTNAMSLRGGGSLPLQPEKQTGEAERLESMDTDDYIQMRRGQGSRIRRH